MADVIVKVLEPANSFSLMTPELARIMLHISSAEPGGSDEFLTQLIETNSDIISVMANRVFARERVRETWRCLGEPCDCEDAKTSRRIFLSHWPVREEEIESVEERGRPVPQSIGENYGWELDERAGRLSIFGSSTAEPIVVTYTGGYDLPDEAPPALRYAAMLLVTETRTNMERESSTARMAGIRSIGHKESRITYETGGITTTSGTGAGGGAATPATAAVRGLLNHFTRLWI